MLTVVPRSGETASGPRGAAAVEAITVAVGVVAARGVAAKISSLRILPPTPELLEYLHRRRHTFWSTWAADTAAAGTLSPPTLPTPRSSRNLDDLRRRRYISYRTSGAGRVTVAGAVGVTVSSSLGLKTRTQFSIITLIKVATDTWYLTGDSSVA